jgi:hypothetical protein
VWEWTEGLLLGELFGGVYFGGQTLELDSDFLFFWFLTKDFFCFLGLGVRNFEFESISILFTKVVKLSL